MRIQTNSQKMGVLSGLRAGDSVRVVYELDGDWVPAVGTYEGDFEFESVGRIVKAAAFRIDGGVYRLLGIDEIVELERIEAREEAQ